MRRPIVLLLGAVWFLTTCATVPHTNRSQLVFVPDSQINPMAARAYGDLLKQEAESTNPKWNRIVKRVAGRITRAADEMDAPGFEWETHLIEKDEPNAFCMPGGKIAVYTGILEVAQNEAGLAAIVGHEVAHAVARHGAERMSQQLLITGALAVGTIALGREMDERDKLVLAAIGMGATVGVILPFSRSNEEEADEIGLYYMARAGYDPHEAPRIWLRMNETFGNKEPPVWLSTHPSSVQRIRNLERLVPYAMDYYNRADGRYGLGETL